MEKIIFGKKPKDVHVEDLKKYSYIGVKFPDVDGGVKGLLYVANDKYQALTNQPGTTFDDKLSTKADSLQVYAEIYYTAEFFVFDTPRELFVWLAE